jgi:hypothetical protein
MAKQKKANPFHKRLDEQLDVIRACAAMGCPPAQEYIKKFIEDRFPYEIDEDEELVLTEIDGEKRAVLKPGVLPFDPGDCGGSGNPTMGIALQIANNETKIRADLAYRTHQSVEGQQSGAPIRRGATKREVAKRRGYLGAARKRAGGRVPDSGPSFNES